MCLDTLFDDPQTVVDRLNADILDRVLFSRLSIEPQRRYVGSVISMRTANIDSMQRRFRVLARTSITSSSADSIRISRRLLETLERHSYNLRKEGQCRYWRNFDSLKYYEGLSASRDAKWTRFTREDPSSSCQLCWINFARPKYVYSTRRVCYITTFFFFKNKSTLIYFIAGRLARRNLSLPCYPFQPFRHHYYLHHLQAQTHLHHPILNSSCKISRVDSSQTTKLIVF